MPMEESVRGTREGHVHHMKINHLREKFWRIYINLIDQQSCHYFTDDFRLSCSQLFLVPMITALPFLDDPSNSDIPEGSCCLCSCVYRLVTAVRRINNTTELAACLWRTIKYCTVVVLSVSSLRENATSHIKHPRSLINFSRLFRSERAFDHLK